MPDSVARLQHPRAHLWLTLAALVLCAPSLRAGQLMDDHVLRLNARDDTDIAGLHGSPLFLFSFTSGQSADNHALMDQGVLLPWWSNLHHQNAFFRPLSSLTHLLDFAIAPDASWWMHLHSLLWFASLLLVVAHVYRVYEGTGTLLAGLAFLLFALDDSHGMTVAWIANRNALIAAAFALPAVSAHHRAVTQGFRPGFYLGPLCFALGLFAGESALAVLGYLFAHALVLDDSPWSRRALRMLPYVSILIAWRMEWSALGMGSFGSGAYHDPGHEPLGFLLALVKHVPVLLCAQLAVPLADIWFWGPPALQVTLWLVSIVLLAAFAWVGWVLVARDAHARFWILGMVLSACVVAASVPGERLLLLPGVGGAMFVAKLLCALRPDPGSIGASGGGRLLTALLVTAHLIVAPVMLPVRVAGIGVLGSALDRADQSLPVDEAIRDRTVLVLNAPFDVMASYIQLSRSARGAPHPQHLHWLASASSPLHVTRVDERTLRIRPERGFLWSAPERHYRGNPGGLEAGARVQLSELDIHVRATTDDGRPAEADFTLAQPLESARYHIVRYEDGRFVPWQPIAVGESLAFPEQTFFATTFAEAARMLRGH